MVTDHYLKAVPVAQAQVVGAAMAAGSQWVMPTASVPVFTLDSIDEDTCRSVNLHAYGVSGVLTNVRGALTLQCRGTSDPAIFRIVSSPSPAELIAASNDGGDGSAAIGTVLNDPLPAACSTDTSAAGWLLPPSQCGGVDPGAGTPPVASLAGQAVIDLGADGHLANPVQVGGNWYYFWTHTGGIMTTHNVLDGLFNHDINGVTNTTEANADGQYGTTDTYRYATINGVRLALPTSSNLVSIGVMPAHWWSYSWSATPSASGHAYVFLANGHVYNSADTHNDGVAVQVL